MSPAAETVICALWFGLALALATWMRADTPMPSWWGF